MAISREIGKIGGAALGTLGLAIPGPWGSILTGAGAAVDFLGSSLDGILGGGSGNGGLDDATNQAVKAQRAMAFNAAGKQGEAAWADAQDAARKYINTQSAAGALAGQRMGSLASQALSAPQQANDAATRLMSQNMWNTRRDVVNAIRMGGGPAASSAAAARALGDSQTQSLTALAGQNASNAIGALSQSGQLSSQQEQMRLSDMAQRMEFFKPHAVTMGAGEGAAAYAGIQNALTNQQAQQLQTQQAQGSTLDNIIAFAGGRGASRAGNGADRTEMMELIKRMKQEGLI